MASVDTAPTAHAGHAGNAGSGAGAAPIADPTWWQRAVFYQVYPLSFQDSDGDGRGDLAGLLSRLDHLSSLGIDAVWLGPVFPSPMHDFGYDIRDFTDVDPIFGSLDTFDRLVQALHRRGMRLVLDCVPNHTSDRHPWFVESRSSRRSARRDWYVWADPAADGGPPNGWLSRFGGSAWQWDAGTRQYYYHAFLAEQPDLNWRHPEVRGAMADVLRFWMRRGVDGFRLDASAVLAEDALLREDPPNPEADASTPPPDRRQRVYTNDRPEVLDWLAELRGVADEFPARVLLGEVDGTGGRIHRFYGDAGRPILHLPLNYALHDAEWQAGSLRRAIRGYLDGLPAHAWPSWLIGGHDKRRIVDKAGPALARLAALLQLTLPGTPVIYQGDELGLPGLRVPSERARDPFERRLPGYGLNRDAERAPMPWNGAEHAGFSTAPPWLPHVDGARRLSVASQERDPGSTLALYRALISLRHRDERLSSAGLRMRPGRNAVLAYERGDAEPRLLVLLNLSDRQHRLQPGAAGGRVLLSTQRDREGERCGRSMILRAHEALVLALP